MAIFSHEPHSVVAFGILGNIISVFVYFAPLPTFRRIIKEKSTMGFQCVPYVMALFSAMLWMYYALLGNVFLLITINSLGCVIETIYIFIYVVYGTRESRKQTVKLVSLLNIGAFSAIFLLTHFAVEHPSLRFKIVGWICVAFSVSVFAAPLSIVFQVVKTRSAEFLPVTLSLALTISAVLWFCYGLLKRDICVAIPNVVGLLLGALQIALWWMYRNPKAAVVEEVVGGKKSPLTILGHEHAMDIVKLEGSDQVHPIGNCQISSDDSDRDDDNIVVIVEAGGADLPYAPSSLPAAPVKIVHIECPAALVSCPA